MKISREWATPITIGMFGVMSVTGILMFFHADSGLNKLAHEWLGWVMIAGVAAHAVVNWPAFKRYFVSSTSGRVILSVSALALAVSFVPLSGPRGGGMSPSAVAMKAVASAPLKNVAALTGKSTDQLISELAKAGIMLPGADANIESVVGGDRALQAKAIGVLFRKG